MAIDNNKVAIVTGASGKGMGRSIALTLAREGATVVVNYLRNRENADEVVSYIRNSGGKAIAVQADVFVKSECERLLDTTLEQFGKVDICVIGPGAEWNPEDILNLNTEKAIEDVIREISPVYNLMPLLMKEMNKRKWGRIIGIATNMKIPSPSYSYNSAKCGRIEALKLSVREAWKMGITVNIVAPGPVDEVSELNTAAFCCRHENWEERNNITPQDIAEGVAFLCSDSARYITGCILPYLF